MKKYYVKDGNVMHSDAGMEDYCGVMYDPDEVDARIAKLERLLDVERRVVAAAHQSAAVAVKWKADAERLGARVNELEKALRFYAKVIGQSKSMDMRIVHQDGGEIARKALGL